MRLGSRWKAHSTFYRLIVSHTYALQVAIIVIGLVLSPLSVLPLTLQARLIDNAIPAGDGALILTLSAEYAAVALLLSGLKFLVTYLRAWVQEIIVRILRVAIIDAQRRRDGPEAGQRIGSAVSALTAEVDDVGAFASEALNTPVIEIGTLISLFSVAFFAEPALAAIGLAALAFQAALTPLMQTRINSLIRKRIRALRRAGRDLIEATGPTGHSVLPAALGEIRRTYRTQLRMNLMKAALKVGNNIILQTARIAIFGYGGWLVIEGRIGVGVVVAFLGGLGQIDEHFGTLLDFYRSLTTARVKYRLVADVIDGTAPVPIQAAPEATSAHPG